MSGLYQLSFLLTGDPAKAEQCFVSGLEDCAGSNRVFREWARSWARRTIIQNAIRMIQPFPKSSDSLQGRVAVEEPTASKHGDVLAALFAVPTFERFVFVMSVLEGVSDQDCKTLLNCSRREIVRARAQSLIRMATLLGTPTQDVATRAGGMFKAPRLLPQTA